MNFSKNVKRTALSIALGMCVAGGVQAQSTTGGIYGSAPAGSSVTVTNNSGFSRSVTVGADGRYNLNNLPIGAYTVDAGSVGKKSVTVTVGGAVDASFDATTLDTVTVTGNSVPKIDVTSTSTSTVITAEQLQRLPLAHSAEAIALLSPGAVGGNTYQFGSNHGGNVSFGGGSVAENAYYINGYFSGTPTTNVGGYSLPYGAIEQQETYTGGYSAKYGRSDGGVINQVGKSGSNDLHFGGQITFSPHGLRSGTPDRYLPDEALPTLAGKQYNYANPAIAGQLYSRGDENERTDTTYSGYISGPLIKDRLFAFVAAEADKNDSFTAPVSTGTPQATHSNFDDPRIYAKLNWQINDDNLLEYTYMGRKYKYSGYLTDYDFATATDGASNGGHVNPVHENDEYSIFKYTSYITDNLTFNATYGRMRESYISPPSSVLPYIGNGNQQNPNYWPGGTDPSVGLTNGQTNPSGTDARDYTHGLRAELQWVLGSHTLTGGIDDMKISAVREGSTQIYPEYDYYHVDDPSANISDALNVGAPGSNYYVDSLIYTTSTSMSLKQKAYYLEDKWQITDNFLLTLGLRNDKFTNLNNAGEAYVKSGDQWAPRIGAAWDVFGDSSLKIFANAGRYFLALPNEVAVRGASSAYFTDHYYTYSGIDSNGVPQNLVPVPGVDGTADPGEVSANNEFGQAKDPAAVAASNLKSEYQDEYILGFEKTLGDSWKYGAKLTYRDLKSAIDDVCDIDPMQAKATKDGIADQIDWNAAAGIGCWLANPNQSNDFKLVNTAGDGYVTVSMDPSDWGWPSGMKRTYKAVDLFLAHPYDGKWEGRIDYTYSKSQGNTEGPANTDTGQGGDEHDSGVSLSQNWDSPAIMVDADGYLPNDRRHQFKAYGSYSISSDWLVSGNVTIMSGAPVDCFDYFSEDGAAPSDPIGYRGSYHTCFGEASPPGKSRVPWTHRYDLGVQYAPSYFDHKLRLAINVFNVFNERNPTYIQSNVTGTRNAAYTVLNTYDMPLAFETPRYVMFSASFDY